MNLKKTSLAIGAAVLVAGVPGYAMAAGFASRPIHIEHAELSVPPDVDPSTYSTGALPLAARISFTNQATTPATDIVFALEENGAIVDRFDDVGTFAPGVSVTHSFEDTTRLSIPYRIAVEKATFADGTVWQNPSVPQQAQGGVDVGVPVVVQ